MSGDGPGALPDRGSGEQGDASLGSDRGEGLGQDVSTRREDERPRVLRRSRDKKVLAGVCGGLARYFDVEPLVVRIVFVALGLVGAFGVVAYVLAWIVIPEAGPGDRVESSGAKDASTAVVLGTALIVIGAFLLVDRLVPNLDRYFWPAALIAIGAVILLAGRRS